MNRVVSIVALAALAGTSAGDVVVAAENLSQEDPLGIAFSGSTWIGQSFTALESGRVTTVDFALTQSGASSGDVTVEVWTTRGADDFPSPDNQLADRIASTQLSYSGLSGSPTFLTADFAVNEAEGLFAGRTYALVFRSDASVRLWVGRNDAYAEGGFFQWTQQFGLGVVPGLDVYFSVAVPSPGGAVALAMVGGLIAARRRR